MLTVAATKAVKLGTRVDFKDEWFDPKSEETPDTIVGPACRAGRLRVRLLGIVESIVYLSRKSPSRQEGPTGAIVMPNWPLGVFASVDAGLGVHLDVAHELGVPTIQLHTPSAASRTPRARKNSSPA